jgi:iron(III) transport system substrate-binding protein
MKKRALRLTLVALLLPLLLLAGSCGGGGGDDKSYITVYVGRSAQLVGPLLEQFARDTGVKIRVRYGDGTELALGILEEGKNSPVDVYYGQDVGALGALRADGRLAKLPDNLLNQVPSQFRAPDGLWVGTSGRSRVIVYNTDAQKPEALPSSILDYTDPKWKDKIGIVPRSDGFPEFVTALRVTKGEAFAKDWLTKLKANNPKVYGNNLAALQATANRDIEVAFLNHYYLYRFLAERGEGFKARNYYFTNGDLGGLFLVAGAAVLSTSKKQEQAHKFIEYLLSKTAQEYFASRDYEYPLVQGVAAANELPPIMSLKAPEMDLSNLGDLRGSLELMRQTGILP